MSAAYDAVRVQYGRWKPRKPALLVAVLLGAAALGMLLLVAVPGITVMSQHPWDVMVFLDAGDRVRDGQVPNRDFHSPQGPLAYLLLAAALEWGGSIGAMMPLTAVLLTAALLPLLIYTVLSRLPAPFALAFGLYALILCVAPFYIGEIRPSPTWGMWYNRFCWGMISLLFLFALPRRANVGADWADAVTAAALWLLLFYIKITYAAVAAPFLLALLWFAPSRRAGVAVLVLIGAALLVVEFIWSGTLNYLGDVQRAASATGAVRSGVLGLAATLMNNALGVYLLGAILLLAAFDRIRYDYLLACLYMAAVGIVLDRTNAQGPGILTFIPAAIVAIFAPRRDGGRVVRPSVAGVLLAGALIFPVAASGAGSLAFHALKGFRHTGSSAGLAGIVTPVPPTSTPNQPSAVAAAAGQVTGCGVIDPNLLNIDATPGERDTTPQQALAIVRDGVQLVRSDPRLGGSVFVPDLSNPFNALLGRPGPAGADAFMDAEVTISAEVHRPPDAVMGGADVLLVPRIAQKYATFDLLRSIYGGYIASHFAITARSACWDAYRRTRTS